jgi:hypothetical protein
MNSRCPQLLLRSGCLLAILTAFTTVPVLSQAPNFGTFKLSPGFDAGKMNVSGYTGGSYSLSAISNRDRDRKPCIGFADPTPDHIMVLEKRFSSLTVKVNSSGYDTTLLVQGPDDQTIRCGDDTGKRKDASLQAKNLEPGTYKIWVGAFDSGAKRNYTLSVQEP